MSTAHDKTKRMPAVGSSRVEVRFCPRRHTPCRLTVLSAAGGVSVEHGLSTVEVQKRYQDSGRTIRGTAGADVAKARGSVQGFGDLDSDRRRDHRRRDGEWVDTAVILAIVLVNGIIGFLQEEKAGLRLRRCTSSRRRWRR